VVADTVAAAAAAAVDGVVYAAAAADHRSPAVVVPVAVCAWTVHVRTAVSAAAAVMAVTHAVVGQRCY
jgi:hypothetical protein